MEIMLSHLGVGVAYDALDGLNVHAQRLHAPQQQKAEAAKAKAEAEAKEKVLESFGVQYQIVSYEFKKHSANPEYLLDVYEMISRQSGC